MEKFGLHVDAACATHRRKDGSASQRRLSTVLRYYTYVEQCCSVAAAHG